MRPIRKSLTARVEKFSEWFRKNDESHWMFREMKRRYLRVLDELKTANKKQKEVV